MACASVRVSEPVLADKKFNPLSPHQGGGDGVSRVGVRGARHKVKRSEFEKYMKIGRLKRATMIHL